MPIWPLFLAFGFGFLAGGLFIYFVMTDDLPGTPPDDDPGGGLRRRPPDGFGGPPTGRFADLITRPLAEN